MPRCGCGGREDGTGSGESRRERLDRRGLEDLWRHLEKFGKDTGADVVLAQSGKDALDVAVVIKGDASLAGQHVRIPEAKGTGMFILTPLDDAEGWQLQGPSALDFASFLPRLAALPAGAPKPDAEGAGPSV
jgi:hypothetical protein